MLDEKAWLSLLSDFWSDFWFLIHLKAVLLGRRWDDISDGWGSHLDEWWKRYIQMNRIGNNIFIKFLFFSVVIMFLKEF